MDNDYYRFTIEQSEKNGILHRASDVALICLKAKAFLDLSKQKAGGKQIDSKHIKKHRNDVFRLAAVLPGNRQMELPDSIQNDLASFIEQMEANPPDTQNMFKAMGIGAIDAWDLIGQLKQTFGLQRDKS
ncbi:MAG: hypothetical protein JJU37_12025 [Balneolaceae bacterium]|nr:hypothetical protein [Balneolaceae bacterium]